MKRLITLLLFLGISVFGQLNLYWRSENTDGNWAGSSKWYKTNDPAGTVPAGGSENLFFDNNNQLSMTNDLSGGAANRFRIFFSSSATSNRSISGSTENVFYDFGGNKPKIENNSSGTHTIGFPIKVGYNPMEFNPVNGNLVITGDINTDGKYIDVYAQNDKQVTFSGVISGTGGITLKNVASQQGIIEFSGNNSYSGATYIEKGTITVTSTGNAGTGTLTVTAGSTLNSSASLNNSSIVVSGTFNVLEDITVNDLTLNSGGTISIAAGKTLTIAAGKTITLNTKLTLGSGNLAITPTANISSSSSNYIVATGTGKLRKMFSGTGSFVYPVGDATNYSPVTLNFTSGVFGGGAYAEINLAASKHPDNTSSTDYLNKYWRVNLNGITGYSCTASFVYADGDIQVGATESNIVPALKPTAPLSEGWYQVGSPNTGTNTMTVTFTNNTATNGNTALSSADFTGGEASALPVELISFNAALRNGMVDLKWETKTEINNYGFEVERKSATSDWSKIGFVEGHGSTNSPKYYSYSDKPSGTGKFSYRLKQIDNDGQFEYSPVVEVLVDNLPNGFVLEQNYPNPFNPETSIRFALKEDTKASLKVFNAMGEEVATLFDGIAEAGRYYDVKFSGNDFSSGFYIYKLVAGDFVSVKKMLLMK